MTITFKVDRRLKPSPSRLPTTRPEKILKERGILRLEAHKTGTDTPLDAPPMHGLLLATHLAFAHHFPLVISPDDVWGCIAQGFSRHVAASGGALDKRLARSKEPVELRVIRNHFIPGGNNDWAGVTAEFCEMMKPHLMIHGELMKKGFSTTGPVERAVHEITQMAAMQRFFRYVVETRCGIPEVTLLGTTEDWEDIKRRALVLREFDLDW